MSEALDVTPCPVETLRQFNAFLAQRVGLHFQPSRLADLGGGIEALSRRLGQPDAQACVQWLMSTPLAQDKVEAIAAELTVGETYFFRELDSLRAIEHHVLPELMRARQSERRLRIWSAGCSTGEEAYTLAIMIDRMGEALRGWQVTILATDIHADALRRAAEATYGDWSFRGVDKDFRAAYFRPAGGQRHALIPRIRERVQFRHLNLADDGYPSLLSSTSGMDLILCRNVLMYFAPESIRRSIDRLTGALADNGYLVTGASETLLARHAHLLPVQVGSATLFRRPPHVPRAVLAGPASVDRIAESRQARHGGSPSPVVQQTPLPAAALAGPQLLARARALADTGQLDHAMLLCARAVAADKLDAAARYLHALVLVEAGRPAQAEWALRNAIYLEPDFVLAYVALAGVLLERGRMAETRRHVDTARALLRTQDALQPLALAEGMHVTQVLRMLDGIQEQLDG